jgi:hypothetical protein
MEPSSHARGNSMSGMAQTTAKYADVLIETAAPLIPALRSAAERRVQRAQLVLGVSQNFGAILRG